MCETLDTGEATIRSNGYDGFLTQICPPRRRKHSHPRLPRLACEATVGGGVMADLRSILRVYRTESLPPSRLTREVTT